MSRTTNDWIMTSTPLLLETPGFGSLPFGVQAFILTKAKEHVSREIDFLVFDPDAVRSRYEDEEQTLRIPLKGIDKKVYVKLDDFRSPETLSKEVGRQTNTQYTLTFMLAEEY